jgi:hypothetical protein
MSGPCPRPECGGEVHTDGWGTPIRCPHACSHTLNEMPHDAHDGCPGWAPADEDSRAEPPTEEALNPALPVRPDPRQPAYDAVYEYIRRLGPYLPPDPAHRNAVVWRAVHAALGATPVGRCISSHCVEGDHIIALDEETP